MLPSLFRPTAALLVMLGFAAVGKADWITIKNATRQTVVIQETAMVNGQPKRSKPTSLLPGESLREFLATPAVKRIEIFDGENARELLWSGTLNCKDKNHSFSIVSVGEKLSVQREVGRTPPSKR